MPVNDQRSHLPEGWRAYSPSDADLDDLVLLLRRHEQEARGFPGADSESVTAEVTGRGASSRRHLIVRDEAGAARGWLSCHDRAAGRVLVGVTVDPELEPGPADQVAAVLFDQAERFTADIGRERGLETNQMDSGAFESDERQAGWLTAAGFDRVRTWWQMTRPVTPAEATDGPEPRPGVVIRRVRRDEVVGLPDDYDLREVHQVLEESFVDHFNSYRETFDEFLGRLREDPGHRWDHWWIAEIVSDDTDDDEDTDEDTDDDEGSTDSGRRVTAGALVATTTTGRLDAEGNPQPDGSYVEYIGVHKRARGRGVAKALLNAVIADAAARGRDRVGLEVDADSPTGADGLYRSMGWETTYNTESWHRDVPVT